MRNPPTLPSIALICLSLVGCATVPTPIARETATRIHRVAVVSLTAKTLVRQYVGLTVFGNEKETLDISDWNVDGHYQEQISAELAKLPGVTVIEAPYPHGEFLQIDNPSHPWDHGPTWSSIEDVTRKYCAANSLDAIVVVGKTWTNDFLGATNQALTGAGIYARGPGNRISVMHLVSKLALLDCSTGKPIAERVLSHVQDSLPGRILRAAPTLPVSEEISRRPIAEWSSDLKQKVRSDLISLPAEAWSTTLRSVFPKD